MLSIIEPQGRGYRKCMLSLWLNKGMFWVSEQSLVDQANTIHRNSWMSRLQNKIKELRKELNLLESSKDKEVLEM